MELIRMFIIGARVVGRCVSARLMLACILLRRARKRSKETARRRSRRQSSEPLIPILLHRRNLHCFWESIALLGLSCRHVNLTLLMDAPGTITTTNVTTYPQFAVEISLEGQNTYVRDEDGSDT